MKMMKKISGVIAVFLVCSTFLLRAGGRASYFLPDSDETSLSADTDSSLECGQLFFLLNGPFFVLRDAPSFEFSGLRSRSVLFSYLQLRASSLHLRSPPLAAGYC